MPFASSLLRAHCHLFFHSFIGPCRWLGIGLGAGLMVAASACAGDDFGGETAFRVPLVLEGVSQGASPVYVGVPFPKGWGVKPEGVAVVDASGKPVPSHAWKMADWPGQESIRWMGVDFVADPGEGYYLVPAREWPSTSLRVRREEGVLVVDTGVARFLLSEQEGALIREAYFDANGDGRFDPSEKQIENALGDDLYLVDQEGREGMIGEAVGRVEVETEGIEGGKAGHAVRLVVRRGGSYRTKEGAHLGRYVVRLHFYAGKAFCRIEHSLIITEDTNHTWFRDYGFRFRYAPQARASEALFADGAGGEMAVPLEGGQAFSFQERAFHFASMDEQGDCRHLIGLVKPGGEVQAVKEGTFAGDWAIARGKGGDSLGVSLPQLWQQFPKELSVSREALTVRLWSSRGGRELDFRAPEMAKTWPAHWLKQYADWGAKAVKDRSSAAGVARTHTLYLDLNPQPQALAACSTTPLCLVDPWWMRYTEAMGAFHPYDPKRFPEAEAWMERWYDQWMSVARQWGEYGFFDYGAPPHTWYRRNPERDGAWEPYLTRYGVDYGFHANLWRMVVRGGGRKYFDDANRMTRQWIDFRMLHNEPMRGLLRTAVYTPRYWAAKPFFHHQSGTDIRGLAYLYYLTDYRPAREMIGHYARTLKQVWQRGDRQALRDTRPFASLKNIATVYQETGDPAILAIMNEQVEWLVDLEAPQGVSREREATGFAKYGVKMGAMQRVHEVSGNELAGKSLVKGAYLRSKTTLGNHPFSYYNTSGERLAEAYRITGDPELVRTLQRDMETAVSDPGENGFLLGVYPSIAGNPYPLGGMAFAMDAIVAYEAKHGRAPEKIPFATQGGFGRPVLVAFEKPAGEEIVLDVRSGYPLRPLLFDREGREVKGVKAEIPTGYLYKIEPSPTCWRLTLPATLPAGSYFLDSGAGGARWEVTWSNAAKMVMIAPGGVITHNFSHQWGNRVAPAAWGKLAWLYFSAPEGSESFEIRHSVPVELRHPDGRTTSLPAQPRGWSRVAVPAGADGKLWAFRALGEYVEMRGVPPFLAYDEPSRYFAPELPASLSQRLSPTASERDLPRQGMMLDGKRRLSIATASLLHEQEGTIECWIRPGWSSPERFNTQGAGQVLMESGNWKLLLHRYSEMSVTALIPGAEKNQKREENAGLILEAGQWTHLAFQWKQEGPLFQTTFFVNGRKFNGGREPGEGGAPEEPPFVAGPFGETILFGGRGKDYPAFEISGLRFSSRSRYQSDFMPGDATSTVDGTATGLFPLEEGSVRGSGASGQSLSAELLDR